MYCPIALRCAKFTKFMHSESATLFSSVNLKMSDGWKIPCLISRVEKVTRVKGSRLFHWFVYIGLGGVLS